jgi:hypothetical protein
VSEPNKTKQDKEYQSNGSNQLRRRADTSPSHISSRWAELIRAIAQIEPIPSEATAPSIGKLAQEQQIRAMQTLINMFCEFTCISDRVTISGSYDHETQELVEKLKRALGTEVEKDFGYLSATALIECIKESLEMRAKNGAMIR